MSSCFSVHFMYVNLKVGSMSTSSCIQNHPCGNRLTIEYNECAHTYKSHQLFIPPCMPMHSNTPKNVMGSDVTPRLKLGQNLPQNLFNVIIFGPVIRVKICITLSLYMIVCHTVCQCNYFTTSVTVLYEFPLQFVRK